ncbi:dihydrolipoamide acetyltransferase component of pyruvate dehydrogenase complex [Mycolicibacterium doricum]|uniref:Dihydrolipoamide acetyltransferase component of pyruvate dehydrogenase complex n=1 Tax=Mycolicibacterium doricum TaxID=126673 RepID=A0A1X1SZP5_9MYCO|nr:dihydrolipoamide acetyltransferase family protein [Mycolicibacterium doricum]MCV7268303.1 2-oxo acid dehydrogenase subunit E2 [Mycolicibacterium doricum]ORV37383.1 branched-chain alpha-keto acid dehydrogenase subunit E2 [Mycolicibacterium doricum]BBZ06527.1 dihydrolipoamide acetyltransferase component of pyruvate dehydrogenase complex [Mycolicibacterium doricum]
MTEFRVPALGCDMDEGMLDQWLINSGDTVTRGQVVAVVETAKSAVEVKCRQEGTVDALLVSEGQSVRVGTPLATLLAPGETPQTTASAAPRTEHEPSVAVEPPEGAGRPAPAAGPAIVTRPHRRWVVSPAARRLAASLNIDAEALAGTGPQGAVTIHDVKRAAAATKQPGDGSTARDRAAAMRASIAAAMSRSKREIPHYYLADEVLLDPALAWLAERNAARPITERVLPAVLQIKAVGAVAHRFPEFNGFWRDDAFVGADGVHVGVAISLRGGGLVAPAIHDVPDKSIDELMMALTDLVARARAGSLRSSEMSDPSITVTNLGDQGVDTVHGVIYPPQVALVGFGKPAQRVCAVDGGVRIATAMTTTLAADHRASDGHRGASFLAAINEMLEQPDGLEKWRTS